MMRTISGGGGNETTTTTTVEAESEEASSATATSSATSASASLRRPSAVLRLRSPAVDAPKPAKIPLFSFASLPSPFVSLTVFSALVLLLVPSEFLLPAQRAADQAAVEDAPRKGGDNFFAFLDPSEEFSCGGGPLSYLAASMISISCDRHSIHLCCEIHDECYEFRHINQTVCDDQFCSCLDTIRSSAYCETVAQPGLCLATRTFGHLFHWSSNCTAEAVEANGGQLPPECSMLLGQPPPDVANQPQLEIAVAVDEQPEVRGKEAKQQHKTGSGTNRETGIDS